MSPNGTSYDFDKVLIFSSSDSSDSESLLQEDLNSNGNGINKQWEAIERTLYQEPGEHVTDPELVKECKLWRETFPHFRVKGSKMDLKPLEMEPSETDKNTQTLKKHFDLKKLEEKRENIKNKVVGMLVDRLIAKHGPSKANLMGTKSASTFRGASPPESGVQITEIDEDEKPTTGPQESIEIKSDKNYESCDRTEKESYFERGKQTNRSVPDESYVTREHAEKSLNEIFDSWDKDSKTAIKLPKPYPKVEPKNPANASARDSFSRKSISPKTRRGRPKPKQLPAPVPLDDIIKPFQMTKKIDKKYEGLLEKIMERKYKEMGITQHCPTSASGVETKSYRESLEKLRIGDGFNDSVKRNTMPKINKLSNNNWLKRREINRHYEEDDPLQKNAPNAKPNKLSGFNSFIENDDDDEDDERFLEELRKEMRLNIKRPPLRSGIIEEINLQRPKPLKPVERPAKCPSCADFTSKTKKETKVRRSRNGQEVHKSESNLKNRVKNPNKKGNNSKVNPNPLFPPIECGLICTEITGRPKVGNKIPPKRY